MGHEIVYCSKCQTRLLGTDFEHGRATHVENRYYCIACAPPEIPPEEKTKIQRRAASDTMKTTARQEIVYCSKCQTRLRGVDFNEGRARRVGNFAYCARCAPPGQQTPVTRKTAPTPKKTTALRTEPVRRSPTSQRLKPVGAGKSTPTPSQPGRTATTATRRVVLAEGSSKSKGILWVFIGVGSLLLAAVVVAIVVTSGGGPNTGKDDANTGTQPPPKPEPEDEDPLAPPVLKLARRHVKKYPSDFPGQIRAYTDAMLDLEKKGSPYAAAAKKELEEVRKRQWAALEPEMSELAATVEEMNKREEFSAALELLAGARNHHADVPQWSNELGRKVDETWKAIGEQFGTLRERAVEARRKNAKEEVQAIKDRVAKWGLEKFNRELDEELARIIPEEPGDTPPVPDPKPPMPDPDVKPPLKGGEAYLAAWKEAMVSATARNYEAAQTNLVRASEDLEEEGAKEAVQEDVKDLKLVAKLVEETRKLLAKSPRGKRLTLILPNKKGEKTFTTGNVVRARPSRLEFMPGDGAKPKIIEYSEMYAATLAELYVDRKGSKMGPDSRAAALLCLLEGDTQSADNFLGGETDKIPSKWWEYAKSPAAKRAPADGRELEARKLLHEAWMDFYYDYDKGRYVSKYRRLIDAFADTAAVRDCLNEIDRRSQFGKEFFFFPTDFKTVGSFNLASDESMAKFLKSGADAPNPLSNYIQFQFFVLPDTEYRGWVQAGACCSERFAFDMQATDLTHKPPGSRETFDMGIGSNAGYAVSTRKAYFPRRTHASHVKRDSKLRWYWIELPLPKYTTPGPKKVRLLVPVKGFCVARALITSTRSAPPKDPELEEIAKARPVRRGLALPKEWLMLGPFKNDGIDGAHPPENGINLKAEYETRAGKRSWRLAYATIVDNKAAKFNYKAMFNPGDNIAVYALIHVKVPATMDAKLLLGSDDGVKVWLNGKQVHRHSRGRGVTIDQDKVKVKLLKGWNRVLTKVVQGGGDAGLAFRVGDNNDKPIEGLEYDAYGSLPSIAPEQ
jgi:hypothetical protein